MERLTYGITINAPKEKVWNTMLDDATYRVWTEVFAEGSHYVGSWEEGSTIRFLAPDKAGNLGGILSRIKVRKPYEHIAIEHLKEIRHGEEHTPADKMEPWAGALEQYYFRQSGAATEVRVELDTVEEYKKMFEDTWPKALQKLKELAEAS
jgi:hypothetical protein